MDVHARSVVAGVIDQGSGEVRSLRVPAGSEAVVAWLQTLPAPVRVVYEAGPTGYRLARACAGDPPRGLRAVVLVDGGYLDLASRVRLGEPGTADREELLLWWVDARRRFGSWPEAVRESAAVLGCEESEQVEEALRQSFVEEDGVVVDAASPELVADLLAAFRGCDFAERARAVSVPTLLLACGQPQDDRAIREEAWTAISDASVLIELMVIEDWSHVPMLQQPKRFADVVGSWLADRL